MRVERKDNKGILLMLPSWLPGGFRVEVEPAPSTRTSTLERRVLSLVDAFPQDLLVCSVSLNEAFNQAVGLVFLHPRVRVLPAVPARNLRCVGAGPCVNVTRNEGHRRYSRPDDYRGTAQDGARGRAARACARAVRKVRSAIRTARGAGGGPGCGPGLGLRAVRNKVRSASRTARGAGGGPDCGPGLCTLEH
eukprot:scaffold97332_cov84-Phaeocystis_antarctica.AAC.1